MPRPPTHAEAVALPFVGEAVEVQPLVRIPPEPEHCVESVER